MNTSGKFQHFSGFYNNHNRYKFKPANQSCLYTLADTTIMRSAKYLPHELDTVNIIYANYILIHQNIEILILQNLHISTIWKLAMSKT